MFTRRKKNDKLQQAIDILLDQLVGGQLSPAERTKVMSELDQLYKWKGISARKPVSTDTLLVVAGNILGILLVINHERVNVISSKALGFIIKPK